MKKSKLFCLLGILSLTLPLHAQNAEYSEESLYVNNFQGELANPTTATTISGE